jgi:hypothetical protein
VLLPYEWHLNQARVPVPAIPRRGYAHHCEILYHCTIRSTMGFGVRH